EAQSTCSLAIHAETAAGPSAPVAYDGVLQFSVASDGSLAQITFTPGGGAAVEATGHAGGRAIEVTIPLTPDRILTFSGLGDQPVAVCQGDVAGIFSGPQPGDIGGWQASASATGSTGAAVATASCPAGQVLCGSVCVGSCPSGQTLDFQSCTCTAAQSDCKANQSQCDFNFECCGGFCGNGACADCPGKICGDMGCVDPFTDSNNCGSCGKVCSGDTPWCTMGVCSCIPDDEPKGNSSSTCCSKTFVSVTGLCGCASMREWCDSSGECCDSGSGVVCAPADGSFKVCCFQTGGPCSSDADCCFSSPTAVPRSACINGVCGTAN
ncbi:MAG: hypothetical protein IT335_11510, partial [Thermomicrobiales bacterium]|nr:hypothetical protein [Thermomicrobiales bacterium]